jgi:two-component system CheB/CheR fusion protein
MSYAAPTPGPRRVLIIEDIPDVAESLRLLLEVLGHEVHVACTGPDGVEQADAWRPDAVVCDIGLPGLDGFGVAEDLTRRSVRATSRLIAVSGWGDAATRERATRCGFHHHLTKPADPAALVALIERG